MAQRRPFLLLVDSPRVYIEVANRTRPDKRRFKRRHNPSASTFYVQIFRFEMVVWYR